MICHIGFTIPKSTRIQVFIEKVQMVGSQQFVSDYVKVKVSIPWQIFGFFFIFLFLPHGARFEELSVSMLASPFDPFDLQRHELWKL